MSKLPMERQQEILHYVNNRGIVKIRELVNLMEGSESTLRRDLRDLERQGMLRSGRGGVASMANETPVVESIPKESRARVGIRAAAMLRDNETVVLDCGSTIMEMVRAIDPVRRFTCVTTSLTVAAALCEKPQVEVIMIGGTVNAMDKAVTGAMAIENLKRFHIDRYFLGTAGISEASGVTGFNLNLIEIRKSIIELSKEVIVLADGSKFEKTGVAPVAPLSAVHRLVTDSSISAETRTMLESRNIELILA